MSACPTLAGVLTMSPANLAITMSPTGTGTVTIAPATAGSINNMSIGATTPASGKFSSLAASFTDSSGTPGNVTNNSPRGLVAIAAAATAVTVTNSLVTATSLVLCQLQTADGTLTNINSVVPSAGAFTVTGNAAATGITKVAFFVVN